MNDPRFPKAQFPILNTLDQRLRTALANAPQTCQRCYEHPGVTVQRGVDNIPLILCGQCEDTVLAYVRRATFTLVR